MFPKIIKAGAGPHDYGSGKNYDETLPELACSSTGSDAGSGDGGDSTSGYPSSVVGCGPELELFHNVSSVCQPLFPLPLLPDLILFVQEEEETFDIVAGYIFQVRRSP